jgi:hypothetical protein
MGLFLALTLLACTGWVFVWWTHKPEPKPERRANEKERD